LSTRSGGYGHLGHSHLDDVLMGNLYDHGVVMRLAKYALPYRFWAIMAFVGMVGHILTMVSQPIIIAWGINSFVLAVGGDSDSWGSLSTVGMIFMGNVLINMVFNFLQYISLARVTVDVLHDLRTEMFEHLQNQATSFYDRNEVGRIMSRIQNDVHQLQEFTDVGITTIGDILMLVFIAGTMLYLDAILGLVTLSLIPLLGIIMVVWQKKSRPTFLGVRMAISAVNGNIQENVSGVRVTQSTNRQDVNLVNFDTLNQSHLDKAIHASWLSAMLMPVVEILTVLSMGLVVVVGGIRVYDGQLELGFLIAFLIYVQRFFEPIRMLTMQYTMFQRAMASGARIFELLDIQPEMRDKPDAVALPPIKGEVVFDNVSFGYTAETEVLHNIDLHIQPGQKVALVGLTGAGKTSLVALMHRFYDVTGGAIRVDGHDLRDVSRESLAGQMSMVLQEPYLYSMSIKDNIRYRRTESTDEEVEAAARAVGAHEFIMDMDNGYDTMLQQRGNNLSMGQRQLISFARAVVADPRIIVLDEATASIDSRTEKIIQESLKAVLRGRTAVVIAHRLSTITSADVIVVLDQGRIIETGSHVELLAKGGLYATLYAMNFGEPAPQYTNGSDEQDGSGGLRAPTI
jgi:ATP-binding cassette subfamily B multidrug efflux pump